jgi:hypothetical protein
MKLSQLIESFVISNDEFEDYLNRATEQLVSELSSGKNPRDAVHDLALTFADQHNKSYDAYQRMADSLEARMHTLEMNSPTDMMNGPEDDMGMGSVDEPEMMSDPMGNMEMNTPASSEMPSDSDMEDYSAVMGEGRMSDQLIDDAENMTKKEFEKKHGKEAARDMFDESVNEHSDTEKARQRALAKADEPERGEERKKVSLKKAPWEESVNEAAECKYCGGDCPNDEEHACDGYLGDIDGLYEAKAMDTIRKIADEKSAMKVKFDNGQMMVDMFTASAIKSVYDNVNDANKEKLDNLMKTKDGMMKVANLSMKMLKEGKLNEFVPFLGMLGGAARAAAGAVSKAGGVANVARKALPIARGVQAFAQGVGNAYKDTTYKSATGRHLESIEEKADNIMKSAIDKVNKK